MQNANAIFFLEIYGIKETKPLIIIKMFITL